MLDDAACARANQLSVRAVNAASETQRGRPRDPMIDQRVLDAVRALLASKGPDGTTIQAVSRLAGVRANAIYRRWATRKDMIEEAIFPGFDAITFKPSGKLRDDIARFAETYRSVLAKPEVLAAMPFLFSKGDDDSASSGQRQAWRCVRPLFRSILEAADSRTCDEAIDPDDIFDMLIGTILLRTQLAALGIRSGTDEPVVDLVCRALRPQSGAPCA